MLKSRKNKEITVKLPNLTVELPRLTFSTDLATCDAIAVWKLLRINIRRYEDCCNNKLLLN